MEQQPISPKSAANFRMIDIGEKVETHRRALASGYFYAKPETILAIKNRELPKGDVLVLCEIAGIQAAKRTIDLLPLCHPLDLSSVRVWTEFDQEQLDQIKVFCEAKTVGKTGVEMEALCGVSAALLCIYDLAKGVDPVLRIGEIQLELKTGGKSGEWRNPNLTSSLAPSTQSPSYLSNSNHSPSTHSPSAQSPSSQLKHSANQCAWRGMSVALLTVSDRASRGDYEDRSGNFMEEWLKEKEALILGRKIVADEKEKIKNQISQWLEFDKPNLIISTGGTGLSPRDVTPEALQELTFKVGGRIVPGIGEALRIKGSNFTPNAWLSRSLAIQINQTIIVCLPGSPKAVNEGLDVLVNLIPHAIKMMQGGGHENH